LTEVSRELELTGSEVVAKARMLLRVSLRISWKLKVLVLAQILLKKKKI
jgi:hypothetical protein